MRRFMLFAADRDALLRPASADDRALITHQRQEMADAITGGNAAVWDEYVDPGFIFAEEDDSYKGKAETLKEIRPLPKGLSGSIHVELLSYHEDGDIAVALFRQVETENYYAQTIHANYLTMTTWRKRADGWKEIAEQVLAEKTDPPAIALARRTTRAICGHLQAEGFRRDLHGHRRRRQAQRHAQRPQACRRGMRKRRTSSSPMAIRASGISSSAMPRAASPASSSGARAGISCGRKSARPSHFARRLRCYGFGHAEEQVFR